MFNVWTIQTTECYFGSNSNIQIQLEKTALNVYAIVNILRKLTGTDWGRCTDTLKKASLALVFSTAEYIKWMFNSTMQCDSLLAQSPMAPCIVHHPPT
jgi:hypothetical protein